MKKIVLVCLFSLLTVHSAYAQEAKQLPQKASVNITTDAKNILGTTYAENSVKKIEFFIKSGNYAAAKQTVDSVSEWIADAAEYHTDLFKTLKKVENADTQATIERDAAIKFAVMRDKVLFLQAKIFIHDGQKRKAVDNLVEVVKSQPNTELGFQAYKLLQDIGFTYGVEILPVKTDVIKPAQ